MNDGSIRRSARFRPGGSGAPIPDLPDAPPAAPPTLRFKPAADGAGTDRDIVFGYQIVLGRDPENSFVIADARSSPLHGFLRGLLTSDEFTGAVLTPLDSARPLPHERGSFGPDEEQTSFLLTHLAVDSIAEAAMRDARSWRDLLLVIAGLPGFPRPLTPLAANGPAADATPGFVMITIEAPRPGELLSRNRIEGSGWVIAPSDIEDMSVLLGAQLIGSARFSLPRPDVARRFPHYRDVDRCGFAFSAELPVAMIPSAAEVLTIVARTTDGTHGRKSVRLGVTKAAETGTTPPAPAQDEASVLLQVEHHTKGGISGWAVARDGIASVALFQAGVALGEAHHGIRREDIGSAYAAYRDSLLAGWSLPLAAGVVGPGRHILRAVATSMNGTTADQEFSLWVDGDAQPPPQVRARDIMPAAEASFGLRLLERATRKPNFSIIVRTTSDMPSIEATLRSLERQAFAGWHATLLVLHSEIRERVKSLAISERLSDRLRIDVSAGAIDVQGNMVCVLRAGDVLGCDALLEFAISSTDTPEADLIYADEEGFLKTDYDPEQLLNRNMIGRAWCASAELAAAAGLTPAALALASNYEIVLRLAEAAKHVAHVPRLLLRRGADADTPEQEAAALADAAGRRNISVDILPGSTSDLWHFRRQTEDGAKISIIMPTCGARDLVRRAIVSIRATTAHLDVEIIVIDHLPAQAKTLRTWLRKQADVLIPAEGRFNWSRFNNQGAAAATGALLVFLNDDIEAPAPGWLEAMTEQAARPTVGVVGAKLLYPDGRVQHAGMYLTGQAARHAFRFAGRDDAGTFGLAGVTREVACVTGACMMMRRDVYDALGGFDEAHGVINNDVDLCLRARRAGLAVIATPHARLVHHELASRAGIEDEYDTGRFTQDFRTDFARGDPWRPTHLVPDSDLFEIETEPAAHVYHGNCLAPSGSVKTVLAMLRGGQAEFVAAVPALRSLRRHFPQAKLTLLASSLVGPLAAREPSISEHLAADSDMSDLPQGIFGQPFDLAIDLSIDSASRPLLRKANAFLRAGFDKDGSFPWLDVALEVEDPTARRPARTAGDRLRKLADAVAEVCEPSSGRTPERAEDTEVALALLPPHLAGRRFACIQPGTGDPRFQWQATAVAALIDLLVADHDMAIVLIGEAAETMAVDSVLALLAPGTPVCSLAGTVEPSILPALLSCAALFVGHDSGAMPLAAALGVPTVSVHDGRHRAKETGAPGDATISIQRQMRCGPCYIGFADECPRAIACLTGLRPQDVYAACRRVLAMGPVLRTHVLATQALATQVPSAHVLAPRVPAAQPADETPMSQPPAAATHTPPTSALLVRARQIASRPIPPPTGHGPQGYIEAVAPGEPGLVWIVGWMQPGMQQDFPAVIAGGGLHPGTLAIMRFARPNLPAGAYGIVGLLACDWQPPVNELGEPLEFLLLYGEDGRYHLRCHMPLRLISTATLAADYQEMLDRYGHALQQSPSLRPHLGILESWQPSKTGSTWQGTSSSVDRMLVVPGLGCLVEGWVMSPMRRVEALRLRIGETIMNVQQQTLGWKPRPDLAVANPSLETMAARAGFVGLFEGEAGPLEIVDPILKLVFEGGTSVNAAVSAQVIRRLGQSARLEDARRFFPALEEETFFPRFAAAAAAGERALMPPPVALHIAQAERVLIFVLPDERCDLFLLFEQVARHCHAMAGTGPVQGVVFLGSTGSGRADTLWMFREFHTDFPWLASSLLLIAEPSHALTLLPDILVTTGAERFIFVADGIFLTTQGWAQVSRALASEPSALVCFTEADAQPGARCIGWSTPHFTDWSKRSTAYLGGFHGDNGLAYENPVVMPAAIRVSRAPVRNRLRDAVNLVLAK